MAESKPSIVTVSVDKFAYPQNEEGNELSHDQRDVIYQHLAFK